MARHFVPWSSPFISQEDLLRDSRRSGDRSRDKYLRRMSPNRHTVKKKTEIGHWSFKGWGSDFHMKKSVCLLTAMFLIHGGLISQGILENPEKPLAENAGRVVALKEVLRIVDEGDKYYFKYPSLLHIATDESIFVKDKDQLLQFDKNGKFIQNYFRKGQGPGELNWISNYFLTDRNIIVHNGSPDKIIWFDFTGHLTREFAVRSAAGSLQFLHFYNNHYYFYNHSFPKIEGEPKIIDNPLDFVSLEEGQEEIKSLSSFPIQVYVALAKGGGGGMVQLNKLIVVSHQQKYLLISHTSEYLVKLFDVEKNQVIRAFRRQYKRARTSPEEAKGIKSMVMLGPDTPLIVPGQKYRADIENLLVYKDNLLVETSTKEKEKGTLIDVFNLGGTYIDNFYLNLPGPATATDAHPEARTIWGDYLYTIEKNEDETFVIKKYKIGE